MKKNKTRNKIIIWVCIVLMTGIFITRYIYINNKYEKPTIEEYNLNEPVSIMDLKSPLKTFNFYRMKILENLI